MNEPAPPPAAVTLLGPPPQELDSVETIAAAAPTDIVDIVAPWPSDAVDPPMASNDDNGVAALRAAVRPAVPSTKSITSPMGALNLKPGTGSLAPSRTPRAMAIVGGGGGLRIDAEAPTSRPSRPMPSRTEAIDAFAPFVTPAPVPAPSSSAKGLARSLPPAAPSSAPGSRPSTGPKSFPPPAGGPPASYERAFRQWSSPSIAPVDDPSTTGPVSFHVYTPRDISRGPMRSMASIPPPPTKASIGVRIGLALVGGVVVLLTAAAVIAVSTEEPKAPASAAARAPVVTVTETEAPPPAAVPSTISIGDPVDDAPPSTTSGAPVPPRIATARPRPRTVASSPVKAAPGPTTSPAGSPAPLKRLAPPPNPYGK